MEYIGDHYDDATIASQRAYLDNLKQEPGATLALEDVAAAPWDVVFQVGGHGPMQDLAVHPTIGDLFRDVLDDQDNAPWLLEDRLRLAGALYEAEPPWTPHVVVDGNLITGQQQVSAEKAAQAVLERLKIAV